MPIKGRKAVDESISDMVTGLNTGVKGVYLSGLGNVIASTPADSGRARNNWFLSVGAPSTRTTTSASLGGGASLSQIAKMPQIVLGKKIYLSNNLPYIGMLEYGGYPNPVMQGSYNKRSGSYEVLSINGYSKQAPNGFVRTNMIKMANKIRSL